MSVWEKLAAPFPAEDVAGSPPSGPDHHNWNGGRLFDGRYIKVLARHHPNANQRGYVREHVLVASAALGKAIPAGVEVHHVNGDKTDNRPSNLVLCENRDYHMLLHRRATALSECGRPGWMKCGYCGVHDDPANMYVRPNGRTALHRECSRRYQSERNRRLSS